MAEGSPAKLTHRSPGARPGPALARLCGAPAARAPDAAIVVPVNAQGDLDNVLDLLDDVARYRGPLVFEVVLVVNNYPAGSPPEVISTYRRLGLRVVAEPDVRRAGEAIGFTARVRGAEAARCELVVLFDADCRVPDPDAVLDFAVQTLRSDAAVCYVHVGFHDLPRTWPNRARLLLHHGGRWIKRVLLRIPTTRGGGYAVRRSTLLACYRDGLLADDMNVGPAVKATGGRVVYGGGGRRRVLTSGRMCSGRSWRSLARHYVYRLRYNLRVLPVGTDAARRTGRERDLVRRYINNRPAGEA